MNNKNNLVSIFILTLIGIPLLLKDSASTILYSIFKAIFSMVPTTGSCSTLIVVTCIICCFLICIMTKIIPNP